PIHGEHHNTILTVVERAAAEQGVIANCYRISCSSELEGPTIKVALSWTEVRTFTFAAWMDNVALLNRMPFCASQITCRT
ncbi:hypothetical protein A2U01_0048519, partial [Trifolium medium]|nr:hypothetical protein [Trifolium medium]